MLVVGPLKWLSRLPTFNIQTQKQNNTVVFAMFHAKDTWTNLKTALMKYREQVNILKEATWRLVHTL